MTTQVRRRRSQAIRKHARHFKVGEVVYLYGCDTGDLYGVLRGTYWITEIKHQSDIGVSFRMRKVFLTSSDDNASVLVEFARGQMLTRLAGPTVSFLIEELP